MKLELEVGESAPDIGTGAGACDADNSLSFKRFAFPAATARLCLSFCCCKSTLTSCRPEREVLLGVGAGTGVGVFVGTVGTVVDGAVGVDVGIRGEFVVASDGPATSLTAGVTDTDGVGVGVVVVVNEVIEGMSVGIDMGPYAEIPVAAGENLMGDIVTDDIGTATGICGPAIVIVHFARYFCSVSVGTTLMSTAVSSSSSSFSPSSSFDSGLHSTGLKPRFVVTPSSSGLSVSGASGEGVLGL